VKVAHVFKKVCDTELLCFLFFTGFLVLDTIDAEVADGDRRVWTHFLGHDALADVAEFGREDERIGEIALEAFPQWAR
jgi:hypothetical protein